MSALRCKQHFNVLLTYFALEQPGFKASVDGESLLEVVHCFVHEPPLLRSLQALQANGITVTLLDGRHRRRGCAAQRCACKVTDNFF